MNQSNAALSLLMLQGRVSSDVIGADVRPPPESTHAGGAEEQFEVREEIMYDRALPRSKLSLDRDEPFPVRCGLLVR